MNDEYTPEDFANARFAEHTDGRIAMRAEPETGIPWHVGDDQIKRLDADMAARGWRPVFEHTPNTTDAFEEEIQDLRGEDVRLKARICILHAELALWQERASQAEAHARKAEAAPLTLDTPREAWENAEVPTEEAPIREGDTLISWLGDELWAVRGAKLSDLDSHLAFRVLHRAPVPEPWQDLADVMIEADLSAALSIPELAEALHQSGVRVVEDEDYE